MPKISVIIPVYNVEKYITRCMDSVVNQTLNDIEIILVEDGSPDNCPQICDAYARQDDRIMVVHQENKGLGLARNAGLDVATGKYVTFVDSDDYISLDAMEKIWNKLEDCHADMCVFSYVNKDDSGEENKKIIPVGAKIFEGRDVLSILLLGMVGAEPSYYRDTYIGMSVWKCAYLREVLENNRIRFISEREYISEDIMFQIQALKYIERVVTMTDALYYYCVNSSSDSLTKKYSEDKFKKYKKLYLKELELLKDLQLEDDGFNRATRMFLGNIRVCAKQIAVNQQLSIQKKLELIAEFCNDSVVRSMLKRFPWRLNPWKQQLFTVLLLLKFKKLILAISSKGRCKNDKDKGRIESNFKN